MASRVRLSPLLLLTCFSAAACVYLFFLDPWGHDTWFHLQRLEDIREQLARGQFHAHFAENAAQGKGLAVWVYYSQWAYWPAALLTSLGATPLIALKIVYCALLALTCVGCYRLLRIEVDENRAALGTLLFLTSNYVIGEIFQRSAYAEFMSVALLPGLLVTMHRTVHDRDWRPAAALVVLASLMVLFHPLSFMNAGLALVAYALFDAIRRALPFRRLLTLAPLFLLALALTAFYWAPAVIETRYVRGAEGVPTPFDETFLSIWRYVNPTGITTPGFALGFAMAVVAVCLAIRRERPDTPRLTHSLPLIAGIVLYLYLTLRISEPLYDAIPFLASNLWVWRVLFPMILLIVIFVTLNLQALPPRLRGHTALGALAGLSVLQATGLVVWNSWSDLSVGRMQTRTIEREVAVESRRTGGFGIDEYLPKLRELPLIGGNCKAFRTVVPQGRDEIKFAVPRESADVCVRLPRYWNTRYAAAIDGAPIPVYANADGEVVIAPAGRHGVAELSLVRPAYVTVSMVVSGVATVLLIAGVAVALFLPSRRASRAAKS